MSNPTQPADGDTDHKVAFLGLGRMGSVMASRLLDAGTALSVWNRTSAKCDPLVARGADRLEGLSDAATRDIVFSMVLDDGALSALHDPRTGILSGPAQHPQPQTLDRRLDGVATGGHGRRRGRCPSGGRLRVGPGQR